jgi:peptidoglycan-associated lipoprotein
MKKSAAVVLCVMILNAFIVDCSKKQVQVSLPQPEPVKETIAATPPVQPEPAVDSAAIVEALVRQALQNIYFDLDNYILRTDATDQLTAIGKVLMEYPGVSIIIEGNCDERGSSDYNMGLGDNRARAAKKWLVAYGIADSRIETTSYGKERLAVEGCIDEPCHQKNRRCEFKIVSSGIRSY